MGEAKNSYICLIKTHIITPNNLTCARLLTNKDGQ